MQREFDFDENPAPGVADIPEGRAYFRLWEVAEMFGYKPRNILRLVDEGKLRALNAGSGKSRNSFTFARSELVRFINENTF